MVVFSSRFSFDPSMRFHLVRVSFG
jgi:hypothetical protein